MEKKNNLNLDNMLSDSQMVDKTLNNIKISNEDVLKSDTNLNIQAVFNSVLGAPEETEPEIEESDMSDDNKKNDLVAAPAMVEDDEENKATVVLDINSLKSELETTSQQAQEVNLDFSTDANDSLSLPDITEDGDKTLNLEVASASAASDDGGMEVDLGMSDLQMTGVETGSSDPAAADGGMDIGGLDLSAEIGALENSTGEVVEDEPMGLPPLAAQEEVNESQDLESSFNKAPPIQAHDEEEIPMETLDGMDDLGFSSSTTDSSDEGEVDLSFDPLAEEAPVAKKEEKVVAPIPMKKSQTRTDLKIAMPKAAPVSSAEEDMFDPPVEEAAPVSRAKNEAPPAVPRQAEMATHQDYVAHHDDELMKLSATIRSLRDDRQQLLDKIYKLEEEKNRQNHDVVSMKAELDEKKIEISLVKKRHGDELNHLRYQLGLTEDRRVMLEEKNKILRLEFDKLASKVRVDFNKIQNREKELENQLELLKADSEVQIRNRDVKILDLKRKIDTLEFDMENIVIKESQSKNVQVELESKLEKTIKTLRNAINSLETEDESLQKFELLKKKNLDI